MAEFVLIERKINMSEQANHNYFLIAGGVISTSISILHVVLAVKPSVYKYIRAGQESALGQMAEQGSSLTTVLTIALAVIFAIWGIYAFSGARLIGPLPLLRLGLIVIGMIYILRALAIVTEVNMVLNQGYPLQFLVFSTISLVTGLLYMVGTLRPGVSI
jgi:heme/copper-type cytochrome/quinol oxidase subunit 2